MAAPMGNEDIRAKILEDIYNRKQKGLEIMTRPQEYADLLTIPVELAEFNIEYLIDRGLVHGQSTGSIGTTKKRSFVTDLTSYGVEAVEGLARQDLAVNFSIISIAGPVTQSQISVGSRITQTQMPVNTFQDLYSYLDRSFNEAEVRELKGQLQELEEQVKADVIKPSTLTRIAEMIERLGPAALTLMKIVQKLIGLAR
jgi:hypothetical protein